MNDKLRNLLVRAASGAVLLAVVLAASLYGYVTYVAMLVVIMCVGLREFYLLAKAKGLKPQQFMGFVATTIMLAAGVALYRGYVTDYCCEFVEALPVVAFLLMVVWIPLIFVVEIFRKSETPMLNVAATIMGIMYLGVPMFSLAMMPMLLTSDDVWNGLAFLMFLFLVWGNDVFAYLVGITCGRHKMCERLSPKKSWEGFIGGVLGSVAVGAVAASVLDGDYLKWMILAVIVSLTSVLGDLVESMFKRDAGVKDSGNIMPGHGGMLDRFDALLVAAPFAFVFVLVYVSIAN